MTLFLLYLSRLATKQMTSKQNFTRSSPQSFLSFYVLKSIRRIAFSHMMTLSCPETFPVFRDLQTSFDFDVRQKKHLVREPFGSSTVGGSLVNFANGLRFH